MSIEFVDYKHVSYSNQDLYEITMHTASLFKKLRKHAIVSLAVCKDLKLSEMSLVMFLKSLNYSLKTFR